MKIVNTKIQGIISLALAMLIFSLQDISVKWIGGHYPVLEIVIFRSLVAFPCTFIFLRHEGKRGLPTTRRHLLEYTRGFLLFLSFTAYMMGVASMPLADVAAIRNSAPLMITFFSVVLLGEKVDVQRWLALVLGFGGVLLIVRPGSTAFNLGSVFTLLATLFYSLNIMITRKLQNTDSSATMAYFSSLVYLAASFILAPLAVMVGEIPGAHPSIAFLFHRWAMPSALDLSIMAGLGMVWAAGMYLVARAYSLAQASVVAPFEYLPMLINLIWGLLLWHEVPTLLTVFGASLTLVSGLFVLLREKNR